MSERSGTSLFSLAIWGALGYAGYCLYRNAKQTLPADATPGDILKAMNPIPTLVAAADKAKDAARDAANTASGSVRDAAQTAKDKFITPNHS